MGNFYKNVTVRGLGHASLRPLLQGREAYLSPESGEYAVVYDRASDETGEPGELVALAARLASGPGTAALAAAVYDDDVLLLWAAEAGGVTFRFDSSTPGTPDVEPLCGAMAPAANRERVLAALTTDTVFASDRHLRVCEALSLPIWAYASGYGYIEGGEPPPDLELDDLLQVS